MCSRPRSSFSTSSCVMLLAFLEPEIQSAIKPSLKTLPTNENHLELMKYWLIPRYCSSIECHCILGSIKATNVEQEQQEDKVLTYYILQLVRSYTAAKSKVESAIHFHLRRNGHLFVWGAYFCMDLYKRYVVVVIKIGAYIHGVLISCGCISISLQLNLTYMESSTCEDQDWVNTSYKWRTM